LIGRGKYATVLEFKSPVLTGVLSLIGVVGGLTEFGGVERAVRVMIHEQPRRKDADEQWKTASGEGLQIVNATNLAALRSE
jgi:hypothetical protein